MSTMRHVVGMLGAGMLAFAGVLTAYAYSLPLTGPGAAHTTQTSPAKSGPVVPAPPSTAPEREDEGEWASGRELVGRWVSESPTNPSAFLEFSEHGLWFASDGCNQSDGWWRIGPDGEFDASGGAMTEIGCSNDVTITALVTARDAEAAEDLLVLTDAAGDAARFTRVDDQAITLTGRWIGPGGPDASTFVTFAADGTWTATTDCTESRGTWELGPMPVDRVPQPGGTAPAIPAASAPGLLRVGSVTTNAAAGCAEAAPGSVGPFSPDADYAFGFRLGGADALESFLVTELGTGAAPDLPPAAREFTRYAVAAG